MCLDSDLFPELDQLFISKGFCVENSLHFKIYNENLMRMSCGKECVSLKE